MQTQNLIIIHYLINKMVKEYTKKQKQKYQSIKNKYAKIKSYNQHLKSVAQINIDEKISNLNRKLKKKVITLDEYIKLVGFPPSKEVLSQC